MYAIISRSLLFIKKGTGINEIAICKLISQPFTCWHLPHFRIEAVTGQQLSAFTVMTTEIIIDYGRGMQANMQDKMNHKAYYHAGLWEHLVPTNKNVIIF